MSTAKNTAMNSHRRIRTSDLSEFTSDNWNLNFEVLVKPSPSKTSKEARWAKDFNRLPQKDAEQVFRHWRRRAATGATERQVRELDALLSQFPNDAHCQATFGGRVPAERALAVRRIALRNPYHVIRTMLGEIDAAASSAIQARETLAALDIHDGHLGDAAALLGASFEHLEALYQKLIKERR